MLFRSSPKGGGVGFLLGSAPPGRLSPRCSLLRLDLLRQVTDQLLPLLVSDGVNRSKSMAANSFRAKALQITFSVHG